MSVTKVMVFLDCVRREGHDFLEDLTKSLQTDEELKMLLTALSKRISAFKDHAWELALSKELAMEEVALRVNLALTATRPVIGNYFNGVLEGLVGSLGIKIDEDEDPPRSTQEGLEKCLAEELEQLSVSAPSLKGCDKLCAKEVHGAILGLNQIPSVVQIHKQDLFKLGPPGNCIVDDIHSHWESYFQKDGVLADAPYSKFQAMEGWDTVYTWDSLEKHEAALTHTYGKKATKLSLMVVVAPTTTEIGDDYFLNKLHKPACIKRKSVYYGAKVAGKRSRVQVVICPYCGVLSQNAPSGCSNIRRHLGLTFACRGCRQFRTQAPKKLQEHLGKCKEAFAAKAVAELTAS